MAGTTLRHLMGDLVFPPHALLSSGLCVCRTHFLATRGGAVMELIRAYRSLCAVLPAAVSACSRWALVIDNIKLQVILHISFRLPPIGVGYCTSTIYRQREHERSTLHCAFPSIPSFSIPSFRWRSKAPCCSLLYYRAPLDV